MHEELKAGANVSAGDVLAGKYRVDRVIGSGGMGVVVAATHIELSQRVALKFLLPRALGDPDAVERFMREARAAVKIDSEHVARVIDVGRLESGAPYLVMEYLEGHDLSVLPKGGVLAVEDAVDLVLQACEAMAVAHTLGIVHRDLKPANLFLTWRPDGSPSVKVLDFGVSKLTDLEHGRVDLTSSSAWLGSPLYMSPEQVQSSRDVDARTDIWALGAILYELLTGITAFAGDGIGAVFNSVLNGQPEPMRRHRPQVPDRLERAVLKALAKDPGERFSDVADLARALKEFAPPRSSTVIERITGVVSRASRPAPSAFGGAPEVPSKPLPPTGETASNFEAQARRRAKTQRRSVTIGLGIAATVAIVAIAAAFHHRSSTVSVAAASSPPAVVEPPEPPAAPATIAAPVDSAHAEAPTTSNVVKKPADPRRRPAPRQGSATSSQSVAPAVGPHKNPLRIEFK